MLFICHGSFCVRATLICYDEEVHSIYGCVSGDVIVLDPPLSSKSVTYTAAESAWASVRRLQMPLTTSWLFLFYYYLSPISVSIFNR